MNALRLLMLVLFAGVSVGTGADRRRPASFPTRIDARHFKRGQVMKPCPCVCPTLCRDGESLSPEPEEIFPPIPIDAWAAYRSHLGCTATNIVPTPALDEPTYVTRAGSWPADPVVEKVRVYAFRDIDGLRYWSAYLEVPWTGAVEVDNHGFNWPNVVSAAADGFRWLRYSSALGWNFDHYIETATGFLADAGYEFWAVGGTPPVTGGRISQWDDQTGNAHHLLQATAAAQPLQVPLQAGGYPSVRFDGLASFMETLAVTQFASHTSVICLRIRTLTADQYVWDGNSAFRHALICRPGGSAFWGYFNGNPAPVRLSNASPTTSFAILSVIGGINSVTMRLNGSQVMLATGYGAGSFKELRVGRASGVGSGYAAVDIVALDIWDSPRTLAQVITAEEAFYDAYVRSKSAGSDGFPRITTDGTGRITTADERRICVTLERKRITTALDGTRRVTTSGDLRNIV